MPVNGHRGNADLVQCDETVISAIRMQSIATALVPVIQRHPSCQLQAERLEAMRAAWPGERERLQAWHRISQKIKALGTGFEV